MNGQGRPPWPPPSRIVPVVTALVSACLVSLQAFAQPTTALPAEPGAQLASPPTRSPADMGRSGENPRDQLEMRIRIAWGDGGIRQWQGSVRLSSGNFRQLVPQGLQADSVAASYLNQGKLVILQPSPRNHDAVDVTLLAPRSAELEIDLAASSNLPAGHREPSPIRIPISELIDNTVEKVIDPRGNHRLVVSRVPGDRLRIHFSQTSKGNRFSQTDKTWHDPSVPASSLLCRQGEMLRLSITPHETGLPISAYHRCVIQLRKAGSEEVLVDVQPAMVGEKSGAETRISAAFIPLDHPPGVYDLTINVYQRKFSLGGLNPLLEMFDALKLERTIQLVILSDTRQPSSEGTWNQLFQIDPANPAWWHWMKNLPQSKIIPGLGQKPMDNGNSTVVAHREQQWTELAPGGWQAFPLPLDHPGQLHELEIEVPNDRQQTLGISIIEPDASGQVVPFGIDSGIDIPSTRWIRTFRPEHHRLVFWPRTESPLVLVTNNQADKPATFGKITLRHRQGGWSPSRPSRDGRRVVACFDKPLFPENFGAVQNIGPENSPHLKSWTRFYQGGERLVRYLPHAGYNAAIIPARCDGGTLYPSRIAPGTPKYGSSAYFTSGQDPVRKDVLEMLFRQFDREGLKLIPAIQFNMPLPELEQQVRDDPVRATGIRLEGPGTQPWTEIHPPVAGLASYYNPTDSRVQEAMRAVAVEIIQRYGHHPSFGGLAIQMTTNGYTQLPGDDAGIDRQTLARFVHEVTAGDPPTAPVDPTTSPWRQRWMTWRCRQLASLYLGMQEDLQRELQKINQLASAQLYLCPADLLYHPRVISQLRPRLPQSGSLSGALQVLGIHPALLSSQPGLTWLEPSLSAPVVNIQQQATQLVMQGPLPPSPDPALPAQAGAQFFHAPQVRQLADFDSRHLTAAKNVKTLLVATIPAAGSAARRHVVQALAKRDIPVLVDGGWTLPLGQEAATRQLFQTFGQLPAGPFEDGPSSQPVLVRQMRQATGSFVYLLNTAPWPVQATLKITLPGSSLPRPLDGRTGSRFQRNGQEIQWRVELEPYDLHAASLSSPRFSIDQLEISFDQQVRQDLQREIHDINYLANLLDRRKPITLLTNPGFELIRDITVPDNTRSRPVGSLVPVGWVSNSIPDAHAEIVERPGSPEGKRSLAMSRGPRSGGPLWIRSAPFSPPRSGRIAVSVWLRVPNEEQQPALRIAIEGKLDGKVYYRPRTVGRIEKGQSSARVRKIGTTWTEFLLLVDDLPVDGLTELRIGFDLMSEGQVWIDNVQIYDTWFQQSEQRELLRSIALAYSHQTNGQVSDCEQFLQGYWPHYLKQFVPRNEPRVAEVPAVEIQSNSIQATLEEFWKRYEPRQLFPFYR